MSTGIGSVAIVAVMLPCALFGQTEMVRLSGRLLGPKEPIRQETVALKDGGQKELATAETDADGRFTFAVRPNQHYWLSIAPKGFYPWNPGFDVGAQDLDVGNLSPSPHRPVHFVVFRFSVKWRGVALR